MSELSDLVNAGMRERGLRYARELARATQPVAKQFGTRPVSVSIAAGLVSGDHGKPSERTLRLLAEVLDVALPELRAAANVPGAESDPYVPPPEADRLDRRQRQAVNEMIRLLATAPQPPDPDEWAVADRPRAEYLGAETAAVHPPGEAPRELPVRRRSACGADVDPPDG